MNERVRRLREQSLNTRPTISMERARLVTEAYQEHAGKVSEPVLRALVFKHLMEHKTVCINDGELIVGERGPAPQAAPTYPELCCHTLEDLDVVNHRKTIFFKVSPEAMAFQAETVIPYWRGRSMREEIRGRAAPSK